MPVRKADAIWEGTLKEGAGAMKFGSGAYDGAFSYASRFEDAPGTNPEELIGAAHAGCFSMFLSALLGKDGYTPTRICLLYTSDRQRRRRRHRDDHPELDGHTLLRLSLIHI